MVCYLHFLKRTCLLHVYLETSVSKVEKNPQLLEVISTEVTCFCKTLDTVRRAPVRKVGLEQPNACWDRQVAARFEKSKQLTAFLCLFHKYSLRLSYGSMAFKSHWFVFILVALCSNHNCRASGPSDGSQQSSYADSLPSFTYEINK